MHLKIVYIIRAVSYNSSHAPSTEHSECDWHCDVHIVHAVTIVVRSYIILGTRNYVILCTLHTLSRVNVTAMAL